ncbi:hypothetical protein ADUPG1_014081, partial [Aduncisulcus paluster]
MQSVPQNILEILTNHRIDDEILLTGSTEKDKVSGVEYDELLAKLRGYFSDASKSRTATIIVEYVNDYMAYKEKSVRKRPDTPPAFVNYIAEKIRKEDPEFEKISTRKVVLEVETYLMPQINKRIGKDIADEYLDVVFNERCELFSHHQPSDFFIPSKFVSGVIPFSQAISTLKMIEFAQTPSDKAKILYDTSKLVIDTLRAVDDEVAADLLQDVMSYVILKGNPPRFPAQIRYITEYGQSFLKSNIMGYTLTQCQVASDYLTRQHGMEEELAMKSGKSIHKEEIVMLIPKGERMLEYGKVVEENDGIPLFRVVKQSVVIDKCSLYFIPQWYHHHSTLSHSVCLMDSDRDKLEATYHTPLTRTPYASTSCSAALLPQSTQDDTMVGDKVSIPRCQCGKCGVECVAVVLNPRCVPSHRQFFRSLFFKEVEDFLEEQRELEEEEKERCREEEEQKKREEEGIVLTEVQIRRMERKKAQALKRKKKAKKQKKQLESDEKIADNLCAFSLDNENGAWNQNSILARSASECASILGVSHSEEAPCRFTCVFIRSVDLTQLPSYLTLVHICGGNIAKHRLDCSMLASLQYLRVGHCTHYSCSKSNIKTSDDSHSIKEEEEKKGACQGQGTSIKEHGQIHEKAVEIVTDDTDKTSKVSDETCSILDTTKDVEVDSISLPTTELHSVPASPSPTQSKTISPIIEQRESPIIDQRESPSLLETADDTTHIDDSESTCIPKAQEGEGKEEREGKELVDTQHCDTAATSQPLSLTPMEGQSLHPDSEAVSSESYILLDLPSIVCISESVHNGIIYLSSIIPKKHTIISCSHEERKKREKRKDVCSLCERVHFS